MRPPLVRDEGGIRVVTLDDPVAVNENQAHGLRQVLYGDVEAAEAPRIVIDLGGIDYMSSTGIALMIGLKRRVEARRGRLILCGLQADVAELFAQMKLAQLFEIVPDQGQAIDLMRSVPTD